VIAAITITMLRDNLPSLQLDIDVVVIMHNPTIPSILRTFTKEALKDLERFNTQKIADFRSKLINYAQLQMHIHRKVQISSVRVLN